jgi:hypothetical protein
MAEITNFHGVSSLIAKMKAKKAAYNRALKRGITMACLFLLAESKKVVPVDTGNLRGSGDWRVEDAGWEYKGRVFYTANYAIFVHENLDARHRPGKIAKYLEEPARLHQATLKRIIRTNLLAA